ncbi:MAG: dihydrofolate reductase [Acidiferrobacteraceae bacterium]
MADSPIISLVGAMARNRVIGVGNRLPWRLPGDLRHFKALTIGHVVIMGRRTFESLGRPLPERRSIVISRNPSFHAGGACTVVDSWSAALAAAGGVSEVFVIGGASLYAQTIPCASRMYLTLVHAEIEGDAYFPEFPAEQWQEISRDDRPADHENPYAYSFLVLERRG